MKCSFCSFEFEENDAKHSCSGCFKASGCGMVKCPRCGYEVPPEPAWIKRLSLTLKGEKK